MSYCRQNPTLWPGQSLSSPQIPASLMQILAKFCACSTAGCAHFRHCTHQQIDAAILKRHHVFAATLAELLVRCASTAQRICNEFAHFLADILRNGGAERTVFSARNTAPTCIGGAPTSCEFQIEISAEETAKLAAPRVKIVRDCFFLLLCNDSTSRI